MVSNATNITTSGYALDARQNNASIEGSLRNKISVIGTVYHSNPIVVTTSLTEMVPITQPVIIPAGTYILSAKAGRGINDLGIYGDNNLIWLQCNCNNFSEVLTFGASTAIRLAIHSLNEAFQTSTDMNLYNLFAVRIK